VGGGKPAYNEGPGRKYAVLGEGPIGTNPRPRPQVNTYPRGRTNPRVLQQLWQFLKMFSGLHS
jgi:hypothetical protein